MPTVKEQLIASISAEDKGSQCKVTVVGAGSVGMACAICILLKVSEKHPWLRDKSVGSRYISSPLILVQDKMHLAWDGAHRSCRLR
jgi:malic enzyme